MNQLVFFLKLELCLQARSAMDRGDLRRLRLAIDLWRDL